MDTKAKPMRKTGVPWQVLDGLAVIVAPTQQKAHELNEVGTFLWSRLDKEHRIDDLCSELCDHYAVDRSQAMTDIQAFLSELKMEGLIE